MLNLGVQTPHYESTDDFKMINSFGFQGLSLPSNLSTGNIIDHLRSTIRAETASRSQHLFDQSSNSSKSMTSPLTKSSHPRSSSFSFSSNEGHLASTEDFDDDDDDAGSQLSAPTTTNASNMVDPKSDEFHIMRKERNRIHAKLTRDRKKLFTARMQQLISTLEKQNHLMRYRLARSHQLGDMTSGAWSDNQTTTSASTNASASNCMDKSSGSSGSSDSRKRSR